MPTKKSVLTNKEIIALIEHKVVSNCDPEKAAKEILELLSRLKLLNSSGQKLADKAGG